MRDREDPEPGDKLTTNRGTYMYDKKPLYITGAAFSVMITSLLTTFNIKESNWLPAPNDEIYPVLRLYWPKTEAPFLRAPGSTELT
jgi:hypothetical protein